MTDKYDDWGELLRRDPYEEQSYSNPTDSKAARYQRNRMSAVGMEKYRLHFHGTDGCYFQEWAAGAHGIRRAQLRFPPNDQANGYARRFLLNDEGEIVTDEATGQPVVIEEIHPAEICARAVARKMAAAAEEKIRREMEYERGLKETQKIIARLEQKGSPQELKELFDANGVNPDMQETAVEAEKPVSQAGHTQQELQL